MSEDRLNSIEKLVESNAKAILALTNQGIELNNKLDRTNNLITELANIVYAIANRQEDHENRINRLEQE
jgi:TolA-binding protein